VKRGAPLKRSRMAKGRGNPIPPKVRAAVLARSGGWCEVGVDDPCYMRPIPGYFAAQGYKAHAQDMHHLVKRPRLHEPWAIVHLCRRHHEMCEAAFNGGRLVFDFVYAEILFSPDKWARGHYKVLPNSIVWRIEVRARKDSELLEVRASGTIAL